MNTKFEKENEEKLLGTDRLLRPRRGRGVQKSVVYQNFTPPPPKKKENNNNNVLHKDKEKPVSICLAPCRGISTALKKSPPHSSKDWTCPLGVPGGMVTEKIEPCINKMSELKVTEVTESKRHNTDYR